MFDDTSKQPSKPTSVHQEKSSPAGGDPPSGGSVEDIFANTDKTPSKQQPSSSSVVGDSSAQPTPRAELPPLKQVSPQPSPLPPRGEEGTVAAASATLHQSHSPGKRKYFIIGIIGIVVIGGSAGAYYVLNTSKNVLPSQNEPVGDSREFPSVSDTQESDTTNETESSQDDIPSIPPPPSRPVDTDGDGLTDIEEAALGSDMLSPDTDNDGLYDREEVKVYLTDPLNADSDGDGYADGVEVKSGFDPKGPGRLFEIPAE